MISLRARWVVPVDRPPIDGGVVTIDGSRIVSVGRESPSGQVQDLGDVALLPGLTNAHMHLEYSLLAQPLGRPGMSLPEWIRLVIDFKRQQRGPQAEAIAAGLRESLLGGVTTLGEIASPGWPAAAFGENPVRAVAFLELLGLRADQTRERLLQARDHVKSTGQSFAPEGPQSRLMAGVSPHAPYSVHPDLLAGAVALARESGAPLAMHVAESREELELLRTGAGPIRDLLQDLGVWEPAAFARPRRAFDCLQMLSMAPRSLVIHGNYLDEEEIEFVGQHADRMAVVYCPRTHAYFEHGQHPLPRLLAAGARVALGTDGRGSNPDLNLLAEMRLVARQFPALSPETILRFVTLDAAHALGQQAELGSLTPGKRADLVALPLPPGTAPAPHAAWLDEAATATLVMIDGVTTRAS